MTATCEKCGGDVCPKCGQQVEHGYGLAGGGFGAYQLCTSDSCDWMHKEYECPYCDSVLSEGQSNCGDPKCVRKAESEVPR